MREIFDSYIETSFQDQDQAQFKYVQFEKNYKRFFPRDRTRTVLDIGIGRGEMLSCMRTWGYRYLGVDISSSTVSFCKRLGLECELAEDTIAWLEGKKSSFSLITCLDVLEHIPKESSIGFLKSIREALTEKGQVIIQVPNLQSPFGYLHHFNDFTHVNGFVEHSLRQVLLASGFRKFQFYGFEEVFPIGPRSVAKLVLRALYRRIVRFMRAINANPNPRILDPVFFVVAEV